MTTRKQGSGFRGETPSAPDQTSVQGLNALRVKVAELSGWKRIHYRTALADHWLAPGAEPEFPTDEVTGVMPFPRPHAEWEEPEDPLDYMPNYPSDLNACAEFEKTLPDRRREYIDALCDAVKSPRIWSNHFDYADLEAVVHATAEQRCRAFVALHEGTK